MRSARIDIFCQSPWQPIGDQDPDIPVMPGADATTNNKDINDDIPGVPADNVELSGVDPGDNNDDQALPDIFNIDNDIQ